MGVVTWFTALTNHMQGGPHGSFRILLSAFRILPTPIQSNHRSVSIILNYPPGGVSE